MIGVARKLIYKAIHGGWQAAVDEIQYPLVFDNEPDRGTERKDGYIQVSVRHGGSVQNTTGEVGSRLFSRVGLIFCNIWTPLDENLEGIDKLAEILRSSIEGKTLEGEGLTVWTFACSVEEQGPVNGFYMTVVETPFRYDVRK